MLLSSSQGFRSGSVCKQGMWGERTQEFTGGCDPVDACFNALNNLGGVEQARGPPLLVGRISLLLSFLERNHTFS